jgi:branched-chain amino acid transport system ATP-binding protein
VNEEVILSGENIDLSFNGIKALDNLDFVINTGQITSIIGPNGAGKTCLINCVTGYYKPQHGDITFEERNILGLKPHQIARLGISRTFQDPTTFPTLTALDILLSGRYIHSNTNLVESLLFSGKSRRQEIESREKVEEVIAFTHIEELRKIPLSMMSYGQRKQVELARALVMQPRVIILDEPMSGLDEVMKEIVTDLVLDMYDRGITILLIEHDIQAVMELSHRIIVLDHGQKLTEGTPRDIVQNERVANAYLGIQVP